ncbi:hypothetical protein C8R43DRAFT_1104776 [Mycena crocata]|nr:hypothetical protein C8R43DRAFT_1104776 [Mycena crocata]
MHRALRTPELSAMICFQISPDIVRGDAARCYVKPDVAANRDLAALARTCSTFQEHALDRLWSYQTSFAPILRCFPNDLWDGPVILNSVNTLKMTRLVVPADWERPLIYMARVKTVNFLPRVKPSEEVLEMLSAHLPTDYFFPCLRDLSWRGLDDSIARYARTLFTPTITYLYLEISTTLSNSTLLPNLALQCPHLKEATINHCSFRNFGPAEALHVLNSTSLFMGRLSHLQRAGADFLDQAAFEHLARLPTLEWLEIFDLQLLPSIYAPPLTDMSPFPRLTNISLSSKSAQSVINAFATLSSSPLRQIDLTVPPTVSAFTTLSEILETSGSVPSLRTLQITGDDMHDRSGDDQAASTSPPQYLIKTRALRRFLVFANMREVALEIVGGFDLDDTLVLEMARAWPHIVSLSFTPECPLRITRRVTLAGLRSFAQYCPNLDFLKIEFDAQAVPPIEPPHSGRITTASALAYLQTGYSPIINSSAVTDFLFNIFPKLTSIDPDCESVEDDLYGEEDLPGSVEILCVLWEKVQAGLWDKMGITD